MIQRELAKVNRYCSQYFNKVVSNVIFFLLRADEINSYFIIR
jgi:hypothetical protein